MLVSLLEVLEHLREHLGSNWLLLSATVAASVGEVEHCAGNVSEGFSEVSESLGGLVYLSNIFISKVGVLSEHNLSNSIHSGSDLEEVGLKISSESVRSAVVGLVEAETGDFETDLVEAAVLLDVKTDLVEFSNGLENLNEVATFHIFVELSDVFVRTFS